MRTRSVVWQVAAACALGVSSASAQTVRLGEPARGAIERPGEVDAWTLQLAPGEPVEIYADFVERLGNADFRIRLHLIGPSGDLVAEGSASGLADARDSRIASFEPERKGRYRVEVSAFGESDEARFRYTVSADTPRAEIVTLEAGVPAEGEVAGGRIDALGFELGEGDAFALSVLRAGSGGNRPMVTLLAPDGRELWTERDTGVRALDGVAERAGAYTLVIRSPNGARMGYTAALSVPEGERQRLELGSGVDGAIDPFGDVDEYTLDLAEGQKVEILADFTEQRTGADYRVSVRLLRPDRSVATEGSRDGLSDARDARIDGFEADTTGAHIVQLYAQSINTGARFGYRLTADTPATALVPLAFGASHEGRVTGGVIDAFVIDAPEGAPLFVSLVRVGGSTQVLEATLRGPSGETIWTDRGSSLQRFDAVAGGAGPYRLSVRSPDGVGVDYALALGPSVMERARLTPGEAAEGAIDAFGDVDEYDLALKAGDELELTLDFTRQLKGADFSSVVRVLGPDRAVLAEGDASGLEDARDSRVSGFRAPADGVYAVQVSAVRVSRSAQFEYRLIARVTPAE